ncbi:MAG TPA: DUF6519 domain-containing protein [Gaiellaceae bacterium]|nr:DUF6519 domain-containing protein [Gaiellaceae bacterium]
MGSDRARVSYDPSRHWRGVVYQEGRVTLEADWNEAETIAAEESREQLLDIVGPAGTPDDGYRVVPVVDANGKATGDLTITAGTLYVGGERMVLDTDLDYASQPDWVDTDGDPLWTPPAVPESNITESVYLLLREQEVGAVEDPALLDIALGGPDTAGRRRIVQRVVRGSTEGATCEGGLEWIERDWERRGLTFDPATMLLESSARLQVGFTTDSSSGTLCDPVAQGGYLGAENQLIRVQVSDVARDGTPSLVWGFDNAYFLYRVTVGAVVQGTNPTTVLTLAKAPVDQYHQPQKDQAVEVLVAAAKLTDKDYIAETSGIVTTVASAYQPDTQQLTINAALQSPTTDSPVVFLRVWQDTIPSYAGGPVELGQTGVTVTLTSTDGYHVGDYWTFAVRPGTPTAVSPVYPQRIEDAPQPPNGPREWLCPLAVVTWTNGVPTVTDCRQHICNLAESCGCDGGCCIEVSPKSVDGGPGLQKLIDRYATKGPVTICLQPGVYRLRRPLVITRDYVGLTIEGCGRGVILQAAESSRIFLLGLVVVDGARDFTLRNVELRLPHVPLKPTAAEAEKAIAVLPEERRALLTRYIRQVLISIGVYLLAGRDIAIEECTFANGSSEGEVLGTGVLAARAIAGLRLVDNVFTAPKKTSVPFSSLSSLRETEGALQVLFGYLQLPTRTQEVSFGKVGELVDMHEEAAPRARKLGVRATEQAASAIGLPALHDGAIEGNLFEGLTVPVLVLGRIGTLRIEENTVRSCYGGFWLVHTASSAALALIERMSAATDTAWQYLSSAGLLGLGDPVFLIASVLVRLLPVTPDDTDPGGSFGVLKAFSRSVVEHAESVVRDLYVASSGVTAKQPEEPRAKKEIVELAFPKEVSGLFHEIGTVSRAGEVTPADPGTAVEPRLAVNGNQVDAVLTDSLSGAGLLVLSLDADHETSLVCSHNRIRSRVSSGAAASLYEVLECAVTGNIVNNDAGNAKTDLSLVLVSRVIGDYRRVAVTGNVLVGIAKLPPRTLPAPFDTWDNLNTIVPSR